jgi:hypothetical protein
MEPCNDQYSNSRNNDLYIYTNRSMCYVVTMNITISTGNTNVHTDRTSLPEQYMHLHSATSDNGFAGTWSPATISTATVGTTTYTFTPTDPCATVVTMNITIRHR